MNDEQRQVAEQSAMLDIADLIEKNKAALPESYPFALRFTQEEWALIIRALHIAGDA